jgi:hypothetical protein
MCRPVGVKPASLSRRSRRGMPAESTIKRFAAETSGRQAEGATVAALNAVHDVEMRRFTRQHGSLVKMRTS